MTLLGNREGQKDLEDHARRQHRVDQVGPGLQELRLCRSHREVRERQSVRDRRLCRFLPVFD